MLKQTIHIPNTSADQLYELLLSAEQHSDLIGDEAVITSKVGETFTTFSGYAEGKNVELTPSKKIVQTWRASDWPDNHYSTITFELSDSNDGATIMFTQENIPEGREIEYESGWEDNYWQPLRDMFSN